MEFRLILKGSDGASDMVLQIGIMSRSANYAATPAKIAGISFIATLHGVVELDNFQR